MKISIIERNPNIEISNDEFQNLYDTLIWKNQPEFIFPGRNAYFKINAINTINNESYKFAKIKGIGFWNPKTSLKYRGVHDEDYTEVPKMPCSEEYKYTSTAPHIGFDFNGNFLYLYSEPSPLGGVKFKSAEKEYRNGFKLFDHGVSVTCPFLLIKIDNLNFKGHELGMVVSLVRSEYLFRLNMGYYPNGILGDMEEKIFLRNLSLSFFRNENIDSFKLLGNLMFLYGRELKKFSIAGIFRHSGGLDNLYFDFDNNKVIFTDLDSSLCLDEISEPRKTLEVFRDLSSCLIKYTERSYKSAIDQSLDIQNFFLSNPILCFYEGYFEPVSKQYLFERVDVVLQNFLINYRRDHEKFNKRTATCLIIYFTNELCFSIKPDFITHLDREFLKNKISNFLNEEENLLFNEYINQFTSSI